MFLSILGLLTLVGLSIGSTFISVKQASVFFNSASMVVFWTGLVVMLAASVLLWRHIRRAPGLLMLHVGCILIIGGAMWGSRKAHELRADFFGSQQSPVIEISLIPGASVDIGFEVKLEKAWTEYYPIVESPWKFYYELRVPNGDVMGIPLQWEDETNAPMGKFSVPGEKLQGEILGISSDNEFGSSGDIERYNRAAPPKVLMKIKKAPNAPALTGLLVGRDYSDITRMSLESLYDSHTDWEKADSPAIVMYSVQPVRDYKAELSIRSGGKEIMRKTIEVNDPLHYGGYHFYLTECDREGHVKLTARSDAGLYVVYAGMILLGIGVFWVMWGPGIFKWLRQKQANGLTHS
jgi:hypothetical protein